MPSGVTRSIRSESTLVVVALESSLSASFSHCSTVGGREEEYAHDRRRRGIILLDDDLENLVQYDVMVRAAEMLMVTTFVYEILVVCSFLGWERGRLLYGDGMMVGMMFVDV